MDYNQISTLLDRYFEGETSLREEAQLRAYFQQKDIEPKLKEYQPLFQFFELESTRQLDQNFDEQLMSRIEQQTLPSGRIRRLLPRLSQIAAAIALALCSWWAYTQYASPPQPTQQAIDWSRFEPQTPEEALEITRAALRRTSIKLNEGTIKAVTEFNKIDKVGKIFK